MSSKQIANKLTLCGVLLSPLWSNRRQTEGKDRCFSVGCKRKRTHTNTNKASVLYSLRPVRVGVEGSALEVVLKVTVFAGVRANSLAMYKNAKTICVLP